ncbi:MAG: alanine--tRNA ligase, partial [Faecalibacterium sp.]|nr:alanine--tRNA ligase [Faecalibacterium sp.]
MQWTGLNELRNKYLTFYEGKGHLRLDSFPLVPKNDPSLLLINSGMAPMKKWFLGQEEPPRHRVTTCQKCIRTPDIERVGITARHGTFFEMLGNFSFQDYFKEEAIPWAWEFLTSEEWMAIPADRLYISVYQEDDEAYDIWTKKVGIPADHMVRFGKEDNFWEHGSGPCGPCSEFYFDRGVEYGCGKPDCKVGCDCDRFMEIWNLVFTQFDSDGKGTYTRLDKPNIDTGMGLERLACVMQGVGNLFEVDTVQAVLKHVEQISGKTYKQDEKTDISIRVITDHVRSCTFMASDGVRPTNEGRGYVMRRLLRRAARHGRMLGINHPFLVDLVETVIVSSESAYPELRENAAYIKRVIGTEEENFYRTIDAGMSMLTELLEGVKAEGGKVLAGAQIFKLHDTYGFPFDLTREIAEENGIEVDEAGFRAELQKQKDRSREERLKKNISGWSADLFGELTVEPTVYTGYETLCDEGVVLALADEEALTDGVATDDGAKDGVLVILDKTPFYAEMG